MTAAAAGVAARRRWLTAARLLLLLVRADDRRVEDQQNNADTYHSTPELFGGVVIEFQLGFPEIVCDGGSTPTSVQNKERSSGSPHRTTRSTRA